MQTAINIWLLWGPCLILGAVSGFLSERVGIVNIGINGMMVFGAFFFCLFSNIFGPNASEWFLPTMILSALCTIVIGLLFAFATVKLKSNHVVVGTAINLFASGIGLIFASFSPFLFGIPNIKNQFNKLWIINSSGIFGSSVFLFLVAILLVGIVYFIMNFTRLGLRYRACGENPHAIYNQGIDVTRYQFLGLMASSFFAGLGGAYYAYNSVAFSGDVSGYGFISLAILIVGTWKILPITVVGLVFGLIISYTNADFGSSEPYLLRTIPYIAALVAMTIFGRFIKPPANVGVPFDKGSR